MNRQETAALLAKIQLGDNREVTELVLREWHDTIGHLEYPDCVEAVTVHRRESTEYLQPAHVIRTVKRLREQRAWDWEQEQRSLEQRNNPAAPSNLRDWEAAAQAMDVDAFEAAVEVYNRELDAAGHPLLDAREEARRMVFFMTHRFDPLQGWVPVERRVVA